MSVGLTIFVYYFRNLCYRSIFFLDWLTRALDFDGKDRLVDLLYDVLRVLFVV